jgi:hypothetical protein
MDGVYWLLLFVVYHILLTGLGHSGGVTIFEESPSQNPGLSANTIFAGEVQQWHQDVKKMGFPGVKIICLFMAPLFLILPVIGQWLFWAGFIKLYDKW